MATIINERDVLLQATTPRMLAIASNFISPTVSTNTFSTTATTVSPSDIIVRANLSGELRGTVTWTTSPVVTVTITDNVISIPAASVAPNTAIAVTATLVAYGQTYTTSTIISNIAETVTSTLSSSAATISTAADGTGGVYTGVTSTMSVTIGTVDNSTAWAYSWSVPAGVTATGAATSTIAVSNMTVDNATLTCTATRTGWPNQTASFRLSKSKTGSTGANATLLTISGPQAVSYDATGATPAPTTATYTATFKNAGTTTYYYRFKVDGTVLGTVITNATGTVTSTAYTIPTSYFSTPKTVLVEVSTTVGMSPTVDTATLNLSATKVGAVGDPGSKTATVVLYQWATTQPGNPSLASTYTWSTAAHTAYTGANSWSTTVSANPGTPLIKLWTVTKAVTDVGTATTTTVDWTSGYSVVAASQNGDTGASGAKFATATVYQWALTIPTISGTSTYTWSTGGIATIPAGWSAAPGTSTPGFTLWAANVNLTDAGTVTTTSINWTLASILAAGYAGATGTTGLSSRICYTKTTLATLASTPTTITTTGSTTFPPNASWGAGTVWVATPPTLVSGESMYQSDGIYNTSTNQTIWNLPYLSSLKVGSLSALTVNTGALTVDDTLTLGTTGNIKGGQTAFNAGTGFFLGYSGAAYKLSVGTGSGGTLTTGISFDGTNLTVKGIGTFGSVTGNSVELGLDSFNNTVFRVRKTVHSSIPAAYITDSYDSGVVSAFWVNSTLGRIADFTSSSTTKGGVSISNGNKVEATLFTGVNSGNIECNATIRALSTNVPTSGTGTEMTYLTGGPNVGGYIVSWDRTNNVSKPLFFACSATVLGGTPTVPATATSAGFQGQIAWNTSFIYVCTSTNVWRRVAVAAW